MLCLTCSITLGLIAAMICDSALSTERLDIRPFAMMDVDRLVALFAPPEVHRFVDDGEPLTREEAVRWVENSRANLERHGYGTGAVIERESGRLIGWAGIARPANDLPEIIYGLEKPAWGRGYGTEILAALVTFSREKGEVPVRATVDAANVRSIALLISAGFRLESARYKDEDSTHLYVLE